MVNICITVCNICSLTSILAKVGIDGVNSNLATAIRTVVVVAMAWGMVFSQMHRVELLKSAKRVGFSYIIRVCNGCFVALLLQGTAGRTCECRSAYR